MRGDGRGGEEKGAEIYEFNHTPNYVMVLTDDPTFEWGERGPYSGHLLVSSPPPSPSVPNMPLVNLIPYIVESQ